MSSVTLKPWAQETTLGSFFTGANKTLGELGPAKSHAKIFEAIVRLFASINVVVIAKQGIDLLKNCVWLTEIGKCATATKIGLSFWEVLGAAKDATVVNADGQTIWKTGTLAQKVKVAASIGAGISETGDILGGWKVFDLAGISATVGLNPFGFAKNVFALIAAAIALEDKASKAYIANGRCNKQEGRIQLLTTSTPEQLRAHYQQKQAVKTPVQELIYADLEAKLDSYANYAILDAQALAQALNAHALAKLQLHRNAVNEIKLGEGIKSKFFTSADVLKLQVKCDKWEKKQRMFAKLALQDDDALEAGPAIGQLRKYYQSQQSKARNQQEAVIDKLARLAVLSGTIPTPPAGAEANPLQRAIANKLATWAAAPMPHLPAGAVATPLAAIANANPAPGAIPVGTEKIYLEKIEIAQAKREKYAQETKKNVLNVIFEIAKIALLSTVIGLTIAGLIVGGPVGWVLLIPALGFTLSAVGIVKTVVEALWTNKTVPAYGKVDTHKLVLRRNALMPTVEAEPDAEQEAEVNEAEIQINPEAIAEAI